MKAENYDSQEEYIEDRTNYPYKKAVSKIDEENLKKISQDMGVDYIHMEKQSDIDIKLEKIRDQIVLDGEEEKSSYVDIYYLFVIPLLGLLVYEFINYKNKL